MTVYMYSKGGEKPSKAYVWNAKAEKNQDVKKSYQNDYFKPRKYF